MVVLAWLVATAAAFTFAVTSYGVALGRGSEIVTPIWFAVPDVLLASLVAVSGVLLDRRGHARTARWVLAMALALMTYAAVAGAAAVLRPSGSLVTTWVVALEGAWFMVPITLCGAACVVAAEELLDQPGLLGWVWRLPAALALAAVVTGFGAAAPEPYPELTAPLAATPLAGPVSVLIFWVAMVGWMLSAALAPAVVLLRARDAAGLARGRLTVVAITAVTPLLTLVSCVLAAAGAAADLVSEPLATLILTIAFCLPPPVVAVGLLMALSARDDGVTGRVGATARSVLRVLWVTVGAQLAALLGALVATGVGSQASVAVSTVAVVLTIVFVAAYAPVANRLQTFMQVEPDDIGSESALAGRLSPRERDVLSLIADGRSNAAIAAELFVSERTVDSHVSSIFDKLGLGREAGSNRRVQAAAAWIRADLESRRQVS